MKISVVIEKDEDGYYAFAPELPGCQSQGRTFEEAESNIKEAVELYLETPLSSFRFIPEIPSIQKSSVIF